jgi:DNA repair ATPase RecN
MNSHSFQQSLPPAAVIGIYSSESPPDPSSHSITREEVRLTIQLHVLEVFRRHFVREEFDNIVQRMQHTSRDKGSNAIALVYDRDEVREVVNSKLRSHRSLIRRHAHQIDGILYKCATTMEEYCDLDNLAERVNEVVECMNRDPRMWC